MSQVKFKLTLTPKAAKNAIGYPDKLFLIGSCFTENIGAKLAYHQFEILGRFDDAALRGCNLLVD